MVDVLGTGARKRAASWIASAGDGRVNRRSRPLRFRRRPAWKLQVKRLPKSPQSQELPELPKLNWNCSDTPAYFFVKRFIRLCKGVLAGISLHAAEEKRR